MVDEEHNEIDQVLPEQAVDRSIRSRLFRAASEVNWSAKKYLYAVRVTQAFVIIGGLAIAVGYWVKLDNPLVSTLLVLLGLSAMKRRTVALGRWRSFLAQPKVEDRVCNALVLGPDFIKEIYQHTPRIFWFMLGQSPNNLLKAALLVGHNLRWFLHRNPRGYQPGYGQAFAISLLVIFGISKTLLEQAGYQEAYLNSGGGVFPAVSLGLLFGVLFYFIYLVERQVIALKRVAEIIKGLATAG